MPFEMLATLIIILWLLSIEYLQLVNFQQEYISRQTPIIYI